jgi:hypothetical protein
MSNTEKPIDPQLTKLTPEQLADLEAIDNGDGLAEVMRIAIEAGVFVDTGRRRDGRIIWERTDKPMPKIH